MPQRQAARIPWLRILVEGGVIVVSILLALAADTWRQEVQDRTDERRSLELLSRDLTETIDQLTEFVTIADVSFDAATFAYTALAGPQSSIDQSAVSAAIVRAAQRRTVRIPSAAYRDLVSTGRLRLIEDRDLRDRIVRFYEDVQRSENIIASNNATAIDRLISEDIFGTGLVLNRAWQRTGVPAMDDPLDRVRDALSADSLEFSDRLWTLSSDSPEWAQVRGTMLQVAIMATYSRNNAAEASEAARSLRSEIEEASRPGR